MAPIHKAKDLIDMPAFVAEALRADGWWLRSEIVWHKPNRAMHGRAKTDRCRRTAARNRCSCITLERRR